jgi:hypothetical protein
MKKPPRIFVPSMGPGHWRALLADPYRQWRREKSAWELAVSWESRRDTQSGLPAEVEEALSSAPELRGAQLLLALPEHRVVLDDERRPSQNDLWAVLRTESGYLSMTVEAKAGEEFDKPIEQWMADDSPGKARRLEFLRANLELDALPPPHVRYQLVHRTASAVLEARRWRMPKALMLVQSFCESPTSWQDFTVFAQLLGCSATRGGLARAARPRDVTLFLGWVDSPKAADAAASAAV